MQELGSFLNQSVLYNVVETTVVILGIAYWAWIIRLSFFETKIDKD